MDLGRLNEWLEAQRAAAKKKLEAKGAFERARELEREAEGLEREAKRLDERLAEVIVEEAKKELGSSDDEAFS